MKKLCALSFVALLHVPLFALPPVGASPATINNADSCDIAAMPAATLLLAYFEVDLSTTPTAAGNYTEIGRAHV